MVRTIILKVKGSWQEVLNDCRFTANKEPLDKEPSDEFKKRMLISEHSPIRDISFKFEWKEIKHWVTVHWVRHKWECFVNTQRSDRTGLDRDNMPQSSPQSFRGEENVQHLIDTDRKRLCFKASTETRECAVSQKLAISEIDNFIAGVLVPNCIYRCGCPEHDTNDPKRCRFFEEFKANFPADKDIFNIQDRYDVYNKEFYEVYNNVKI